MVWRFRKSFKILPGVRLNIGKNGISTSFGGRGATLNLSKRGKTTTIGIPGTGISHSTYEPDLEGLEMIDTPPVNQKKGIGCLPILGVIFFLGLVGQCIPDESAPTDKAVNIVGSTQGNAIVETTGANASADSASKAIDTVAKAEISQPPTKTQYFLIDKARTFSEPSASSAPAKVFDYSEPVEIIEKGVDWSKVIQNGLTFWVLSQHLSDHVSPNIAKAENTLANKTYSQTPQNFKSSNAKSVKQATVKKAKAKTRRANSGCSCGSGGMCTGPRGGRYCLTSNGNKNYGR
ncbi:MAG: hypothetical protein FD163_241 [Hyphomonadaceae bacterium]|nr:MAG: hypothetical protein FD128_189 [Hyphomonadaceae bacterium]KAF0186966.1 MAG: hypothetical protein FD163_241 [Hyphomonadaceae bacterium]